MVWVVVRKASTDVCKEGVTDCIESLKETLHEQRIRQAPPGVQIHVLSRKEWPVTGPPSPFCAANQSCSLILAHNQETPKPPAASPEVESVLSGQERAPKLGLMLILLDLGSSGCHPGMSLTTGPLFSPAGPKG